MASLDFFRNIHHEDPLFFDEGPKISRVKQSFTPGTFHNTSSIETFPIDGYRQGVELTQQKYFDAGLAKIHAGEPGHVIKTNRYGMDKNFRNDPRFEELDYFNPEKFLRAQDNFSPLIFNTITFPIITSDNDQIENYLFNGIIEPFTIRSRASFFSIEAPFEAHEPKGAMMAGNTDITWASDQIQTIYSYDQRQHIGFLDQYADSVAFAEQEAGQSHASSNVGFFRYDKSPTSFFNDSRFPRNTPLATNYDSDMNSAISLMSGSTENYVSSIIGKRSATCGWDYDNNTNIGTDSIAFGGMIY